MDPVTHTLTAITLARAGAGRLGRVGTATVVAAANVADLDYLYVLGGADSYLEHRFTWSHSLVGALILSGLVALGAGRLAAPTKASLSSRKRMLLAGLGAFSHLLLDWSTSSGTQLLWPFRDTRFALDWFSFIDPLLLFILLLGLALPALFRLIAEEIGARRSEAGARRAAWVALAACALLAAGRAGLHNEAVAHLESRLYRDRTPLRAAAFPHPLNPFLWQGVVETSTSYESGEVRLLGPARPLESFSTFYKPTGSPALAVALATPVAGTFLAWARFPHIEVLPAAGEGWRIRIQDLRQSPGTLPARVFTAWIELNKEQQVERETITYSSPGEELSR